MADGRAPADGTVQWTYDLRGLDLLAWAGRAGPDLAAHRAAGDSVTLLVGTASPAEVAALREALAGAGYPTQEFAILGVPALALGDAAPPADEATARSGSPPE